MSKYRIEKDKDKNYWCDDTNKWVTEEVFIVYKKARFNERLGISLFIFIMTFIAVLMVFCMVIESIGINFTNTISIIILVLTLIISLILGIGNYKNFKWQYIKSFTSRQHAQNYIKGLKEDER